METNTTLITLSINDDNIKEILNDVDTDFLTAELLKRNDTASWLNDKQKKQMIADVLGITHAPNLSDIMTEIVKYFK